jgi:hypothetical protein
MAKEMYQQFEIHSNRLEDIVILKDKDNNTLDDFQYNSWYTDFNKDED